MFAVFIVRSWNSWMRWRLAVWWSCVPGRRKMREETNEIWVQHGTTMSSQRDIFGIPIISDYLPYTIYDTCVLYITMAITITNNYIFLRYWVGFAGYSSKQLFSKMGFVWKCCIPVYHGIPPGIVHRNHRNHRGQTVTVVDVWLKATQHVVPLKTKKTLTCIVEDSTPLDACKIPAPWVAWVPW